MFETENAIKNGAEEIDMEINIGAGKSGEADIVKQEIQQVADAAKGKATVKVMIETSLLTDEEKVLACR
ncbi:MAG: hypothetical protein C6W57_05640 [Caldibacillus debilis]|nr:MAG: hypothetical protein C6W57_05640 [Caldibacillus debilis]